MAPDIKVKTIFVRHRTKKNEWLAILSSDYSLSEEDIIRICNIRWDIETFFKCKNPCSAYKKSFRVVPMIY